MEWAEFDAVILINLMIVELKGQLIFYTRSAGCLVASPVYKRLGSLKIYVFSQQSQMWKIPSMKSVS